jgi:hypothetical protein
MTSERSLTELPEPQTGACVMDSATRQSLLRKPGRILTSLREIRQESSEQTALATGMQLEHLLRVERGEVKPSASDLQRLATHHKADARVLLDAFGYAAGAE